MKVLLLLAKGFEHMETAVFIDVLGWAREECGHDIHLETCGFQRLVNSTFGVALAVDKLIDEICVDEYAAIAIPGGFQNYGFYEEAFDGKFSALIREANAKGILIASVCVAALALGKSGVLTGRAGTTYHLAGGARLEQLGSYGVNVRREPIVVDANIITSSCPETAVKVAFILLEMLTSPEQAATVKRLMGYEAPLP